MKVKFKYVLLIAALTTLAALIVSFMALPDNSGYAGLFFIVISPVFVGIFIIWTFILLSVGSKKTYLHSSFLIFLTTLIFEYLLITITMGIMSSDSPDYDLNTFLTDSATAFSDKAVLICICSVAVVYAVLLKYIGFRYQK